MKTDRRSLAIRNRKRLVIELLTFGWNIPKINEHLIKINKPLSIKLLYKIKHVYDSGEEIKIETSDRDRYCECGKLLLYTGKGFKTKYCEKCQIEHKTETRENSRKFYQKPMLGSSYKDRQRIAIFLGCRNKNLDKYYAVKYLDWIDGESEWVNNRATIPKDLFELYGDLTEIQAKAMRKQIAIQIYGNIFSPTGDSNRPAYNREE